MTFAPAGSSPLTQGKLLDGVHDHAGPGFIPAHAGKTGRRTRGAPSPGAHPRSRRENCMASARVNFSSGSSPLTRGKLATLGYSTAWRGLIPAHAGKTVTTRQRANPTRAHPHSRGENDLPALQRVDPMGSSPLTRGKQRAQAVEAELRGLIPTHAGKTVGVRGERDNAGAHPHSCGENPVGAGPRRRGLGSSPLMRGKPRSPLHGTFTRGLIPAHAGKTLACSCSHRCARAHPRSCGENPVGGGSTWNSSGSSPLTRGKHPRTAQRRYRTGLIPTHAGKTSRLPCRRQ